MCKDNANERRISSLLEYFAECSLSSAKITANKRTNRFAFPFFMQKQQTQNVKETKEPKITLYP